MMIKHIITLKEATEVIWKIPRELILKINKE
jgi:hypothetical protein